jgi:hypothetical protein
MENGCIIRASGRLMKAPIPYSARHPIILPDVTRQPRSQGFSLFVIGKSGKGPGTGRSHDFQHPDIVGVNKL